MSQTKSRDSRFGSFAIAVWLLTALPLMTIHAKTGGNAAKIAAARGTFQAKCALCHGSDGAGSAVGKTMNIPDFRSSAIQKLSDSELAGVIANGKNAMPSFKGSLSAGQIDDMVAYVRTLGAKK